MGTLQLHKGRGSMRMLQDILQQLLRYTANRQLEFLLKISAVTLVMMFCCYTTGFSQNIANGDGSPQTTQYCHDNKDYILSGIPAGGIFSGCGMHQQNGEWYFNPVIATQAVSVFPYSCAISYIPLNGPSVSRSILVYKPVIIDPPLQDSGTCTWEILLHATMLYAGAYNYQWQPAYPLSKADTSYTKGIITGTTTFIFSATDQSSGCTGGDTITIVNYPAPEVSVIQSNITLNAKETTQLRATGASSYYWQPSQWLNNDSISNSVASPQAPVTYRVVGNNEFDYTDSATVILNINEAMFVPNAFSPNNDGLNDVFKVENIGYQSVKFFQVYNRRGQSVFQTFDGCKFWNGMYNGKPAEASTYYYLIKLGIPGNSDKIFKGEFSCSDNVSEPHLPSNKRSE